MNKQKIRFFGCFVIFAIFLISSASLIVEKVDAKPVNDNQPPIADAGGPYHWRAQDTKIINGNQSYDPDGEIVYWRWYYYRICGPNPSFPVIIAEGPDIETVEFPDNTPGYNEVWLYIEDNNGSSSTDNSSIYVYGNSPGKPEMPIGPSSGQIGTSYDYSTVADHPDFCQGDGYIQYAWDFGDDSEIVWTEWFQTKKQITVKHTWQEQGSYEIRVKTRDRFSESEWSDPLSISMPKDDEIHELSMFRIIKRISFFEKISEHPVIIFIINNLSDK